MPARAIASAAATSTCSQVSYFRWSLQMRPISGWVYRRIIDPETLRVWQNALTAFRSVWQNTLAAFR
jgi:hypothetical protein